MSVPIPQCVDRSRVVAVERSEVVELHYICPTANVGSILLNGIVSHTKSADLEHESVADELIQDRRQPVVVPGGLKLHDYVNLYFNGRNPMMYTVAKNRGVEGLCLLRVSPEVLDLDGVVVADCNASSDYVRFADPINGLKRIDRERIFARSWNHTDHYEKVLHKSQMCAEVLVPEFVSPIFVLGAYIASEAAGTTLSSEAPSLAIKTDRYKFFEGG